MMKFSWKNNATANFVDHVNRRAHYTLFYKVSVDAREQKRELAWIVKNNIFMNVWLERIATILNLEESYRFETVMFAAGKQVVFIVASCDA